MAPALASVARNPHGNGLSRGAGSSIIGFSWCNPRAGCFNRVLRRIVSILLLAVFGLPFALPMLTMAQDTEAGLPACCRRNGQHHCMMSMDDRGRLVLSHDPQFQAPAERCPYCPSPVAPTHPNPLTAPTTAAAIFGELVSHPTGFSQTEARRRISHDRANGKRGPPTQTLL